jgi:hypothetical protein
MLTAHTFWLELITLFELSVIAADENALGQVFEPGHRAHPRSASSGSDESHFPWEGSCRWSGNFRPMTPRLRARCDRPAMDLTTPAPSTCIGRSLPSWTTHQLGARSVSKGLRLAMSSHTSDPRAECAGRLSLVTWPSKTSPKYSTRSEMQR